MFNILTQTTELVNNIQATLWSAVGVLLTAAISYGAAKLSQWLKSKIKDDKLRSLVDSTIGLAEDIVIAVNQTFVDDLVKEGKFDKKAQKQALDKAKAIAKEMITSEGKELITSSYGDLDKWLEVVIEAKVKEVKNALLNK